MNKRISSLLLFVVIAAFFVFAMLRVSDKNSDFFENYYENAQKNIAGIKNFLSIKFNADSKEVSAETSVPAASNDNTAAPQISENPGNISKTEELSAQTTGGPFENVKNVSFENAKSIKYAVYKNYIVCVNKTSLMAFDKHGNSKWAVAVSFSKPILKTAGNYILLADKGGRTISVFIGEKLMYSINAENVINYASISSKGEVVAVTEKEQYLSCIVVYNKEGNVIFSRSIGSNEVIAADISSSRYLGAILIDTDKGVSSKLQIWNINSESEYSAAADLNDTLVFDTEFYGETLSAIADNGIYGFNNKGKNLWTVSPEFAGNEIISTHMDDSGRRITVFDNNTNSYIKISDSRGIQRKQISSEIIPDFADICYPVIAYNNGRNVLFGRYNKPLVSYTSDKDIFGGILIDRSSLVIIHSASLEFIDINQFLT